MSVFKGSNTYSVDSKGRINIPARMRKAISPEANETFTITRGFEKCLFVYPQDEWAKIENKIRALSQTNPQHRFFMRMLLQQATESQLDAQARITIPKELLDYASIDSEVFILGLLDHIELWNPNEYKAYLAAQQKSYAEVAETVLWNNDV